MSPANVLRDAVGQELPGYLNASAGKGKPGLIVLHEWWGLNAQTRGVADRFAQEGFVVFAADLYGGQVATTREDAGRLAQELDREKAVTLLLRATAALKSEQLGAKVGITGFCMGGSLALLAATRIPGLAACVPFYGLPDRGRADYSVMRAAVQAHFAQHDDWCTPERVDQLEQDLQRLKVRYELYRYDAQHAFMNEQRPEVYSAENAQLAFRRAVDFLHRELG
ncbi:MAG: dienelactone hydrolase family protein [Myxococcaceae bacterium]|nr:dienelactone hydrolase family protein [Myxococcaceae bacterium]